MYLGKTGTYEGFGKQSTDEKAHSFFKWVKNRELKFCLEDETKLEFGQESTFITNFITNFMAWFGWEHRGKNKTSMSERKDFGRQSVINSYFALKTRLQAENVCMVDTTVRPRKETYLYDMDAVDEAIINAFVHNDWNISEPLFCMFDDRLEILSYGGMPYSQTKERFFQGISVPKNLFLMRVFQNLEITDKTGHGTVKIISAYGKEVFDIQDGLIQVTIPFGVEFVKILFMNFLN